MLIVTTPEAVPRRCSGQVRRRRNRKCKEVCGTSDLEIGWGYMKQVEIVSDDRSSPRNGLGLSERPVSLKELVGIREM
jgi:hypothetical protein